MPDIEAPLPAYSRDIETTSIRSAAPSYFSNAPSYHSQRVTAERGESHSHSQGRTCRGGGSTGLGSGIGSASNVSWSSIQGHQSRAYLSVANRRAARPQPSHIPVPRLPLHSADPASPSDSPAPSMEARRERDEEALREESKSWEFMLSQMADWDEREREWRKFRAGVEERGKGTRLSWTGFRKANRG
ncbi:MAG: hypothetical protein M1840_002766 [Geoglossum simile]|nr:MAG: hypothetical protein M1840_002766 [Geoglossum simile]